MMERLFGWLGGDARRLLILLATCGACAVLVVDFTRVPSEELQVGDVAPRTVEAPSTFRYQDFTERERRQQEAREAVPWVFVHRASLVSQLQARIRAAYAAARAELGEVETLEQAPPQAMRTFRDTLGVHVPDQDLAPLVLAGLPQAAEEVSVDLLGRAMAGLIVADRDELPFGHPPITVIALEGTSRREYLLEDLAAIGTPGSARERISLTRLDADVQAAPWSNAAVAVARARVVHNLDHDHLGTAERAERAAAEVPMAALQVKRGTTLFRQGDVLTELDLVRYRALQSSRGEYGAGFQVLSVGLFLLMLFGSLYHFGSSYLQDFSTRTRDTLAVGALVVLTALLARVVVAASPIAAAMVGPQMEGNALWFVVPVAGAAMLVRLLVGVSWTMVFAVAAAAVCGLMMDLGALYVVFFLLSAVAAAGSVEHTRERMAVLRAGLFTGLINAVTVLVIHFLQLVVVDSEVATAASLTPVWGMAFAFIGGILSAFMVLALVPLFETGGFVTDYRMMELASLNHPLLRQLMLRAPGSYHHSVIVGSLAEAAAESVGANALLSRVASYFHDIGKAIKPQYFVENQAGGLNRHDRLDPRSSAEVIIGHVIEGGRMAKQHNLPKPIVDNIYMHHGTGLLYYFFSKASEQAAEGEPVDDSAFRYPGPRPNTREAGIIMLADKIEAATRTIADPTEQNIRAMIDAIVNSVIADGQFEDCPLTFQELYIIAEAFVKVLMGIYHHRIEYPQTAAISKGTTAEPAPPRPGSVITLEIPNVAALRKAAAAKDLPTDETEDYEAVENLPGRR